MELTEATARLVRRYWLALLLAIALPMVVAGGYALHQPRTYTAHVRFVAAATTPNAQAQADAVVSQVQAIATSRDVVAAALTAAQLRNDPTEVIKAVVVTGLGSSGLVDLSYTDTSATQAQAIVGVVANQVVAQLSAVRIGGLPSVLKSIDDQLTTLAEKRAPIAATAQANPHDAVAQNRLAGIDGLISDLSSDRNRLAEQAAAAGQPIVVDTAALPLANSRGLSVKMAIAAILGLVLGLLLIGLSETMRPAVSGATRVASLLEVPTLGTIRSNPAALGDIGRRLRLAGRRAAVSVVVLVRMDNSALAPELVDRIQAATLRPDPVPARIGIPIDGKDPAATDGVRADGMRAGGVSRGRASVAMLTMPDGVLTAVSVRFVCALDELDPAVEGDRIGLVVLAGARTRLKSVEQVRDLLTAAGWPLLGVLDDSAHRGGAR